MISDTTKHSKIKRLVHCEDNTTQIRLQEPFTVQDYCTAIHYGEVTDRLYECHTSD